jgi:hypothetical protein
MAEIAVSALGSLMPTAGKNLSMYRDLSVAISKIQP